MLTSRTVCSADRSRQTADLATTVCSYARLRTIPRFRTRWNLVWYNAKEMNVRDCLRSEKKPSVIPQYISVQDWQYGAIVEEKVPFGLGDYVNVRQNFWILSNDTLDLRVEVSDGSVLIIHQEQYNPWRRFLRLVADRRDPRNPYLPNDA